jgi:hypothetical protein
MLAHCGCDQTPNFGTVGNVTTFITLERILATEKITYIGFRV